MVENEEWFDSKVTAYLSKDAKHIVLSLKRQQNICNRKRLFNINIEANSVHSDQTAPTGAI